MRITLKKLLQILRKQLILEAQLVGTMIERSGLAVLQSIRITTRAQLSFEDLSMQEPSSYSL